MGRITLKTQVAELTARVARLEAVIADLTGAGQHQEELIWDDNGCEAGYYTLEELQDKWAREDNPPQVSLFVDGTIVIDRTHAKTASVAPGNSAPVDEVAPGNQAESGFVGPMRRFHLILARDWMTGGIQQQPCVSLVGRDGPGCLRAGFEYEMTGFIDAPDSRHQPRGSVFWSHDSGNDSVCFDF